MGILSYYYLKTLHDTEGRLRLRPLSGQKLGLKSSGVWIDTTKNVSCEKGIREKYPLGTVFAAKSLEWNDKGFYKVKDFKIYPVEVDGSLVTPPFVDGTTQDMIEDYANFKVGRTSPPTEASPTPTFASSAKAKKKVPSMPVDDQDETDEKTPYPSLMDRLKRKESIAPPTIEEDGFYITDEAWYLFIRNIRYKRNTLMLGDSGTGKTEAIYWLSKKLKKQITPVDMGAMLDPLSGLLGTHRIKNKESVFDYAQFVYAVQQPGIILLDELNRAPVTTNNILFPCLDSRRELPVDIADMEGSRRVKLHPDCVFFATANIGAEYTGTGIIDRALMERFFPYEMKYLPTALESRVLVARTGIGKSEADLICWYANKIREIYAKGELSIGVSIRHTLEIASMVVDGFSFTTALELIFLPVFEGTKTSGERATIAAIIASK